MIQSEIRHSLAGRIDWGISELDLGFFFYVKIVGCVINIGPKKKKYYYYG